MTEPQWRAREKRRREAEGMSRAEAIKAEMAGAVRVLGAAGRNAKEGNYRAAQLTGLSVTVIERLRWRKIQRIPADICDAVRDALQHYNEQAEAKAQHERHILATRLAQLDAWSRNSSDPEFLRAQAVGILNEARRAGLPVGALAEDDGGPIAG